MLLGLFGVSLTTQCDPVCDPGHEVRPGPCCYPGSYDLGYALNIPCGVTGAMHYTQ